MIMRVLLWQSVHRLSLTFRWLCWWPVPRPTLFSISRFPFQFAYIHLPSRHLFPFFKVSDPRIVRVSRGYGRKSVGRGSRWIRFSRWYGSQDFWVVLCGREWSWRRILVSSAAVALIHLAPQTTGILRKRNIEPFENAVCSNIWTRSNLKLKFNFAENQTSKQYIFAQNSFYLSLDYLTFTSKVHEIPPKAALVNQLPN